MPRVGEDRTAPVHCMWYDLPWFDQWVADGCDHQVLGIRCALSRLLPPSASFPPTFPPTLPLLASAEGIRRLLEEENFGTIDREDHRSLDWVTQAFGNTGFIGYDLGQVVRDFDVVRARALAHTRSIDARALSMLRSEERGDASHRCPKARARDQRPRARDGLRRHRRRLRRATHRRDIFVGPHAVPQVSGQEDKSILEIILTRNYKYWAQQFNPNPDGDQGQGQGYYHDLDNPYAWNLTDTTCDCPPHFGRVRYNRKNHQLERAELITRRGVRMEFDWTKHVGPAHACVPRPVTRHAPSTHHAPSTRGRRRVTAAATPPASHHRPCSRPECARVARRRRRLACMHGRFYSHIQLKPVQRTVELIEQGLETYEELFSAAKKKAGDADGVLPRIWLDYFNLRQCRNDFVPADVLELVSKIGMCLIEWDFDPTAYAHIHMDSYHGEHLRSPPLAFSRLLAVPRLLRRAPPLAS